MQTTKAEAFPIDWVRGKMAWVRIRAGSGEYGLGEARPMANGNASLEIRASVFARRLVGAEPMGHRVLRDRLFHEHIKIGPEGA